MITSRNGNWTTRPGSIHYGSNAWPGRDAVNLRGKVTAALTALVLLAMIIAQPSSAAAAPGLCSSPSHTALAARISRGIEAARHGRESFVAVEMDDPGAGIVCRLDSGTHFDSASVVKVTILGTLLRG